MNMPRRIVMLGVSTQAGRSREGYDIIELKSTEEYGECLKWLKWIEEGIECWVWHSKHAENKEYGDAMLHQVVESVLCSVFPPEI